MSILTKPDAVSGVDYSITTAVSRGGTYVPGQGYSCLQTEPDNSASNSYKFTIPLNTINHVTVKDFRITTDADICCGTGSCSYIDSGSYLVYCNIGSYRNLLTNTPQTSTYFDKTNINCDSIEVVLDAKMRQQARNAVTTTASAIVNVYKSDDFCSDGTTPVNKCVNGKKCIIKGSAASIDCCIDNTNVGSCNSAGKYCAVSNTAPAYDCRHSTDAGCSASACTGANKCSQSGSTAGTCVQCLVKDDCKPNNPLILDYSCTSSGTCQVGNPVQCIVGTDCAYSSTCSPTDGANGKNCDFCIASKTCTNNVCQYTPAGPINSNTDGNCCTAKGWLQKDTLGTTGQGAKTNLVLSCVSITGSSYKRLTCPSGLNSFDGCHYTQNGDNIIYEGQQSSASFTSSICSSLASSAFYYKHAISNLADADCSNYQCPNGIKEAGENCANCNSDAPCLTAQGEKCITTQGIDYGTCVRKCASDGTLVGDCSTAERGKKCMNSGSANDLDWKCTECDNQCPSGFTCNQDSASSTFNQCIPTCSQKGGYIIVADQTCPNNDFYQDVYEGSNKCCKAPLIQTCAMQSGIKCPADQQCLHGHTTTATDSDLVAPSLPGAHCCVKDAGSTINQECKRTCDGIGRACLSTERCKGTTESTADVSACCLNDGGTSQCSSAPSISLDTASVAYSIDEILVYDLLCTPANICDGRPVKAGLYAADGQFLFDKTLLFDAAGKASVTFGKLTDLSPPRAPGTYTIKIHQDPYLTFPAIDFSREVAIGTGLKVVANTNDILYNNEPIKIVVTITDYSDVPVSLSRLTATATIGTQTVTPTPEMTSIGKYSITITTQQVGLLTLNLKLEAANAKTYDRKINVDVRKPTVAAKVTIDGCTFTGTSCDATSYAPLTIRVRTYDPQEKPVQVDLIKAEISKSAGFPDELKFQRSTYNPNEWTARFTPAQETGVYYTADITVEKAGWDTVPIVSPKININTQKTDLLDPVVIAGALGVIIIVIVGYGFIQRKLAGGAVAA